MENSRHKQVVPDSKAEASKKEQVSGMFDAISPHYDFLNRLLSMGIDMKWRRRLIRKMLANHPKSVLDVATGTGDLAVMAARRKNAPKMIKGVDISEGMLEKGREKIKKKGLEDKVELKYGDSEKLPFSDNSFDAVCVAFGVRNYENLHQGIREMHRVLRPGGHIYILEFSQPQTFPFKQLYNFYFQNVLPIIGRVISKHNKAYSYLPESVSVFPSGREFAGILESTGFKKVVCENLTLGISSLYIASK